MTIFRPWFWLIPVLLLTVALSAAHLDEDTVWLDEWLTYWITGTGQYDAPQVSGTPCENITGATPFGLFCLAAIDNAWPPAFYVLLALWDFGSQGSTFLDRALALFIGLLAVSAIYSLGKRMVSHETGLMAAIMLASCAFFVYYNHEMRGHTLFVLVTILTAWFYWLLIDTKHHYRRRVRYAFVICVALSLYTHYIAAAVILGIGLYHFLVEKPGKQTAGSQDAPQKLTRKRWFGILRLGINGCLLFAPWAAVLIISVINESMTQRSVDTLTLLSGLLYGLSNNLSWLALPALAASLFFIRERPIVFLWILGMSILVVALVGNIFANFLFHPRHIIGLLPIFILVIAMMLQRIPQAQAGWMLLGIWVGAGVFASSNAQFMTRIERHVSSIPQTTMSQITAIAQQCVASDDVLVVGIDEPGNEWMHDLPLGYYLGDVPFDYYQLGSLVTERGDNTSNLVPVAVREFAPQARVDTLVDNKSSVWVVTQPSLPLQSEVAGMNNILLDAGFMGCPTIVENDSVVGRLYSRRCTNTCNVGDG